MMEKIIEITPAYDKRDSNPNKNGGIHGVELRFLLKGKKGVIQFLIYTNWMLPKVQKEVDEQMLDRRFPYLLHTPLPADLGYHSLTPRYDGQTMITPNCPYLDGKACYSDGSSLNAKEIFEILLQEGDKGLWKALEDYYSTVFGNEDKTLFRVLIEMLLRRKN